VNLLVHADYAEPDASLIIQSPEGYLFRNPGSSRVLESDLLTGNRSDPRNPELVRMFRFIGACDEGGTGIPKIIASWKSLGFKIPTIDVGTERYEFTIRLRQVHLISEEDLAWLGTLDSSLSEAERLSLVIAKYDGDVDNFRLRQVTNQHSADVTKILRGLRSRDLLRMIGSGHKAKYELGPAAVDNLFFSPPLQEPYEPSNSYTSNEASYTSSENPYTTSSGSYRTLEATTVWDTLEQRISAIKGQRRVSPSEREASIISLLEVAPLSMQDLKRLTSLSEPYLRQILQSLAQKGDIVFLFPQQPSHPSQKYCLRSRVDQNG
jgi:predicted HTH transcriptional regulator